MNHEFDEQLRQLRQKGLMRQLRQVQTADGLQLSIARKDLINWGSNDYLGLSRHPALVDAATEALGQYGVGSGSSRLITGTSPVHEELETAIAMFKGKEAALTFSSGYATATGVLNGLVGKEDVIILDKLCHACLIDGAKLSRATLRVFPHNHMGRLESLLEWAVNEHQARRIWVVTESVFSMDGDTAHLSEIVELKQRYPFLLLVDEAHAVGVLGHQGRGLIHQLRLTDEVDLIMGTMSKALGVSGGYLASTRTVVDLLVNRARSFVYSTAPPPSMAAAALAAIRLLQTAEGESIRRSLHAAMDAFASLAPERFQRRSWKQSAIFPVLLGETRLALSAAKFMAARRCFCPAIRYPTVPKDRARLRISLTAAHGKDQIDQLASALIELEATLFPAEPENESGWEDEPAASSQES